jgi:hypothetical protein
VSAICYSGGWAHACNEVDPIPQNGSYEPFGPFGLPVNPSIVSGEVPFVGPAPFLPDSIPQDSGGTASVPVAVWDGSRFTEALTESQQKTAASVVEPKPKASGWWWWILAVVAAVVFLRS